LRESRRQSNPKASRPHMPGYGVMFQKRWKALPWTWANERLSTSYNYWVATTRENGRPHVMPIWGIWLDSKFYFSTGRRSRKSRNLKTNPRCVICTEGVGEAVIMEGRAEELRDFTVRRKVRNVYMEKYGSDLDSYSAEPIYAVQPQVVFGLVESSDKIRGNPTRWRFEPNQR
jgi:nitroimidazol reductase NimA-like FMN-containing flavoprotein (pyridoxamine 5'-phosphate oxidase superfamily)